MPYHAWVASLTCEGHANNPMFCKAVIKLTTPQTAKCSSAQTHTCVEHQNGQTLMYSHAQMLKWTNAKCTNVKRQVPILMRTPKCVAGTIPSEVGRLTDMKHFWVSHNRLGGTCGSYCLSNTNASAKCTLGMHSNARLLNAKYAQMHK